MSAGTGAGGRFEGAAMTPSIATRMASVRPALLGMLAMIALLALLMSFVHLVHLSVQQGEAARAARAAHADALWRCNALRAMHPHDECRLASL